LWYNGDIMILEWLTKHRRWVIAGCVIVFGFTILVEVFSSYCWASSIREYFQHWSLALGAGATLTLAYIAYISILENRRIREKDRELGFKARSLNEINDWAEEVIKLVDKFQCGFRDTELFDRKLILKTKTITIESVGPEFSDYFRVRVEKALKDFWAFDEEFNKERWDSLQEKSEQCKRSLINLLESVAYLKVDLKV